MKRLWPRLLLVVLLLCPVTAGFAEKVADLPIPTTYVNDFAHVLTAAGAQQIEDLSTAVHQQANAELFVVTINTLDDGQTKEEFTSQLEEKWKAGKKGEDRSAIVLLVMNPRGVRIEIGYGLEGILNDAKVGAILDANDPIAKTGNYDASMLGDVQAMADVIAKDANVTLTLPVHQYHREQAPPQKLGIGQIILGGLFVLLILYLLATGRIGWVWFLLSMFTGNGGGGRDDDDRGGGGGFGGIGGGSSGGGGASRDF